MDLFHCRIDYFKGKENWVLSGNAKFVFCEEWMNWFFWWIVIYKFQLWSICTILTVLDRFNWHHFLFPEACLSFHSRLVINWENRFFSMNRYDASTRLFDTRCGSFVRRWEEPFDEAIYCLATDNNMTLVCGTARYCMQARNLQGDTSRCSLGLVDIITEIPAYSDTLGTWEKCHCN